MLITIAILLLIGLILWLGYAVIDLQEEINKVYEIQTKDYFELFAKIIDKQKEIDNMPMKSGKSKKVISENIKEGMDSYKAKGTFGNSTPKSAKAAQKQIIAAAYSTAGKSKKKSKKR